MRETMAATALSFLMAVGGGAALANSNPGGQTAPSSATPSSETSGSQASGQKGTQANGQAPEGFAEEEVTSAPLTVEKVDKKNRNLVLRAPDGTQSTVDIPSGTPGFDSLKKGDKVEIDYFAAEVFGPGNQKGNNANQAGSTSNGSSNQGGGSSSANQNGMGRVHNIRKVGSASHTGNSGNSGNMGNSGSSSGGNQENR